MRLTEIKASFPLEVEWSVTWKCNLSCRFCSTYGLSCEEYDYNEILKAIIKSRPLCVTLSGGEPLLHPQIGEIILSLSRNNIAVNLTTNGTELSRLSKSIIALLNWVRVSVHSADEQYSTLLMGKAYDIKLVEQNIRDYQEINNRISLFSLAVNEIDLEENILSVIDLAVRCKVAKVLVCEPRMLGKAKQTLPTDAGRRQKIYARLVERAAAKGIKLFHPESGTGRDVGCPTSATSISVWPDGSVRACCFQNEVLGRVNDEHLNDIWSFSHNQNFECVECKT